MAFLTNWFLACIIGSWRARAQPALKREAQGVPAVPEGRPAKKQRVKQTPRRTTASEPNTKPKPWLGSDELLDVAGHVAFLVHTADDLTWYVGDASATPTVGMLLGWLRSEHSGEPDAPEKFCINMVDLMYKKTPCAAVPGTFPAELQEHLADFRDRAKWRRFRDKQPPMPVTVVAMHLA